MDDILITCSDYELIRVGHCSSLSTGILLKDVLISNSALESLMLIEYLG